MYSLPYGSRDKQRYFSALAEWLRRPNELEIEQVERCFEKIASHRDYLGESQLRYIQNVRNLVNRNMQLIVSIDHYDAETQVRDSLNRRQLFWIEPVSIQISIWSSCRSGSTYPVPGQPVVGASSLGMIGRATEWLLRTGSVPFTTVMGMLGFGLLGATFSTFIRERRVRARARRAGGRPCRRSHPGNVGRVSRFLGRLWRSCDHCGRSPAESLRAVLSLPGRSCV
jgi:hypothetical protein